MAIANPSSLVAWAAITGALGDAALQVIVKAIRQERPLEQLLLPSSIAEGG